MRDMKTTKTSRFGSIIDSFLYEQKPSASVSSHVTNSSASVMQSSLLEKQPQVSSSIQSPTRVMQSSSFITQSSTSVTQSSGFVTQSSTSVTQPSSFVTQSSTSVTQSLGHVTQSSSPVTQSSSFLTRSSAPISVSVTQTSALGSRPLGFFSSCRHAVLSFCITVFTPCDSTLCISRRRLHFIDTHDTPRCISEYFTPTRFGNQPCHVSAGLSGFHSPKPLWKPSTLRSASIAAPQPSPVYVLLSPDNTQCFFSGS